MSSLFFSHSALHGRLKLLPETISSHLQINYNIKIVWFRELWKEYKANISIEIPQKSLILLLA